MRDEFISLNGEWEIEYLSPEVYDSKDEPKGFGEGILIKNAIPGYVEDMREVLSKAPFFDRIAINPLYKRQTYPETGYCEDTVLKSFLGSFSYRRQFTLTDLTGKISLYVGGVQNRLSLWINGKYVGTHLGYSSEFELDIPCDCLRIGQNSITLTVSSNRLEGYMSRPVSGLTSRAANECTCGVYGDVELRIRRSGIVDAWVTVSHNLTEIKVSLELSSPEKRDTPYLVSILDGERVLKQSLASSNTTSLDFSTGGLALWTPESPKLYTLTVTDGESTLTRTFGVRRLTVSGTQLMLNGKPYFFRGFCEHCYHPITIHPTRDEGYYENVIAHAKALGFNSIRFHTYVPPVEYMRAADRLGILIEVETPNNTTLDEWGDIVKMSRRHTSVVAYSSGNEMVIDEDYIEHLRKAARIVHEGTDSLFSPMSAMRGIEYHSFGDFKVDEPFTHNPKRLEALGEFCDLYNTYSLGLTSYNSVTGDPALLDYRNSIYKKPLLTHEICIHGTYCDLSVEERYKGTRIGETEMFSSVREHLTERGLIDRADEYFKASVYWQKLLRKHCFETVRRAQTFAGYDFLGDIDTHWHTFGYSVGMMNEFYELKSPETVENVLRYNSDSILLADLPNPPIFDTGADIEIPILISCYGKRIDGETLTVTLSYSNGVLLEKSAVTSARCGAISKLMTFNAKLPNSPTPVEMTLKAVLTQEGGVIENEWKLYAFPTPKEDDEGAPYTLSQGMTEDELIERLKKGERVVILGSSPFKYEGTSFQISLAGRTNGHLATLLHDTPLLLDFPKSEPIGWHLAPLLNGGKAVMLDIPSLPFEPMIEIATSYKNAHREGILFEYAVGEGKLLVCSANLNNSVGRWLVGEIKRYASSDRFAPKIHLTAEELVSLIRCDAVRSEENTNLAFNKNDITAR